MERKGIAVAGSILVDTVNSIKKYPHEGELTHITSVSKAVGGLVPNVGIDLKKLCPSLPVFAVGKIGDDEDGKFVTEELKKNGVDSEALSVHPCERTSFTQVISITGGQRTFFTYPGASDDFGMQDIPWDTLSCRIFHLGYFLLLGKIDRGEGLEVLKEATARGMETSIDLVSENSDRYKDILPCLPYTDYLIVNELEAGNLAGMEPDPKQLSAITQALLDKGVRKKVIVHFKEGAVCRSRGGDFTQCPSIAVPKGYIKGTTGAGDAFCAGALLGIAENLSDKEILDYGTVSATMALRTVDATAGLTTIDEAFALCGEWERN